MVLSMSSFLVLQPSLRRVSSRILGGLHRRRAIGRADSTVPCLASYIPPSLRRVFSGIAGCITSSVRTLPYTMVLSMSSFLVLQPSLRRVSSRILGGLHRRRAIGHAAPPPYRLCFPIRIAKFFPTGRKNPTRLKFCRQIGRKPGSCYPFQT